MYDLAPSKNDKLDISTISSVKKYFKVIFTLQSKFLFFPTLGIQ